MHAACFFLQLSFWRSCIRQCRHSVCVFSLPLNDRVSLRRVWRSIGICTIATRVSVFYRLIRRQSFLYFTATSLCLGILILSHNLSALMAVVLMMTLVPVLWQSDQRKSTYDPSFWVQYFPQRFLRRGFGFPLFLNSSIQNLVYYSKKKLHYAAIFFN